MLWLFCILVNTRLPVASATGSKCDSFSASDKQFPIYFIFKLYNTISFRGISPRSRQAGDNRGFYCTIMEPSRCGVLNEFYPEGPNLTPFQPQTHGFRDIAVFNPANLLILFQCFFFEH